MLGVLPGVIGCLEAVEVVKILLGVGDLLVGRLVHYDALAQRFTELEVRPDPGCAYCAYCAGKASFPGYPDYQAFCSATSTP